MAITAQQTADFDRMRAVLRDCVEEFPKIPQDVNKIYSLVLRTAKTSVEWCDEDVGAVAFVAGIVFLNGDDTTQAMTFEFMRNLINVFCYERSLTLNGATGGAITKLLGFYPSVVLRYSNKPALLTKASQHAAEHVREDHPYRLLALKGMEMSGFADYEIERFEKKALKNLLIIAKEKILCYNSQEILMPNILTFIQKVCENQSSCGIVIRVCHVLEVLFENIASRQAFHEFDMFKGSLVFHWIIRHTDPSRMKKKCWVAVAQFIKSTFLFADFATTRILVASSVFPRINDMLRDSRKNVTMELLKAVEAACKDSRIIYHQVTANIFLRILPIVEDGFAPIGVREKACEVFTEFLRNAPLYEVSRASENGVIAALVKLLKSRHPLAVTNALTWMREIIFEGQPYIMRTKYAFLIIAAGGDGVLRRLCIHPKDTIREPAQEIFRRLHPFTEETTIASREGDVG